MSLNKRVKGDFNIESVDEADSVQIKSQTIRIAGIDFLPISVLTAAVGVEYEIVAPGDTDFTLIGSADSLTGTVFTATGAGIGTGTIINVTPNTVIIDGHLTVSGTTNTVDTTNTSVVDTYMTLNSGETSIDGVGGGAGTAGILIDRGTAMYGDAGIRFNENVNAWELNDGDINGWQPIGLGGGGNEVIDDLSPQLGGNLDVNGKLITSAAAGDIVIVADTTGLVKIDQDLSLKEQVGDETPLPGYNKIYAKVPGGGGSGLFVSNLEETDELVSRKKALAFSIIF